MKRFIISTVILTCISLSLSSIEYTHSRNSRRTLQEALDMLEDGDSLIIKQGIYVQRSRLYLDGLSNISIRGEGEVWIICSDVYDDVFRINDCGPVVLENLKMRHQEPLEQYECHGSVVSAMDVSGLIINGCELNGCGAVGVYASSCEALEITNCFIHNNSWVGIYLYDIDSARITSNTIVDNSESISMYDVKSITMHSNIIAYNAPSEGEGY